MSKKSKGGKKSRAKAKAKPRAKHKKVTTTTTTRTTRDTVIGKLGLGDLFRSQEEHVDAVHVALEDGDCKRAAREINEARSHGPVPYEKLLVKQMRQSCPTGIDGLGKAPRKIRGLRGRPKKPSRRIQLPADAYLPDGPPLPWAVYALGYGTAAFVAYKFLTRNAAASGLGGCGGCVKMANGGWALQAPCQKCSGGR